MTGLPLSVTFPFVPTFPLFAGPLYPSSTPLPLMVRLLQPFAVANKPKVEREPTPLIELVPAPVSAVFCVVPGGGAFPLLSVTVRKALAMPDAFVKGENFTSILQLAFLLSVAGQVLVCVKYTGLVLEFVKPIGLVELITNASVDGVAVAQLGFVGSCPLQSHTVCAALEVPPAWLPNDRTDGVSVAIGAGSTVWPV